MDLSPHPRAAAGAAAAAVIFFARKAALNLNVFDTDIGNDQHIHTVEGGKGKSKVGGGMECACVRACVRVGVVGEGVT